MLEKSSSNWFIMWILQVPSLHESVNRLKSSPSFSVVLWNEFLQLSWSLLALFTVLLQLLALIPLLVFFQISSSLRVIILLLFVVSIYKNCPPNLDEFLVYTYFIFCCIFLIEDWNTSNSFHSQKESTTSWSAKTTCLNIFKLLGNFFRTFFSTWNSVNDVVMQLKLYDKWRRNRGKAQLKVHNLNPINCKYKIL